MKSEIQSLIQDSLSEIGKHYSVSVPADFSFDLSAPRSKEHGDLATNVALKLSKLVGQNPREVASVVQKVLEKNLASGKMKEGVKKLEIEGPGFLNFFLSQQSVAPVLLSIKKQDRKYGSSEFGKGRKALVEFVSANPTGPLTIAHGRQAAIGDSLVRILKMTGHETVAEYYLNDAGRQMNLLGASLWSRYQEVFGRAAALPEDGYKGVYLIDVAKQLASDKKDSLLKMSEADAVDFCRKYAGDTIMKGIQEDLAAVSVRFDHYFNESSLYQKKEVDKALDDLSKRGFIFNEEGAVWFRSTAFGDDKDRVVKKSTGEFTYLAPDIAYHRLKFERGFKWLINLWGPDHHGYVPRLKAACQALGHDTKEVDVLIVQLTTLFRQGQPVRMSTRAGEFVTLKELVDEVGADAARFFFVMRRVESHLDFDLDLAKSQSQDNPVYYLQYAHARISSILENAKSAVTAEVRLDLLKAPEEFDLAKKLEEFPEILVAAAKTLEPYRVVEYLRELAALFHKFYTVHRVLTDDADLTAARLLLVDSVRIVLRNGLELLGVSQPAKM